MNLLRDNALIYGRLLTVQEPHLIARYNKALAAFGLSPTALARFEIDRTGFSPQVAEELGDPDYLDPTASTAASSSSRPRRPNCRSCTLPSPTRRS